MYQLYLLHMILNFVYTTSKQNISIHRGFQFLSLTRLWVQCTAQLNLKLTAYVCSSYTTQHISKNACAYVCRLCVHERLMTWQCTSSARSTHETLVHCCVHHSLHKECVYLLANMYCTGAFWFAPAYLFSTYLMCLIGVHPGLVSWLTYTPCIWAIHSKPYAYKCTYYKHHRNQPYLCMLLDLQNWWQPCLPKFQYR